MLINHQGIIPIIRLATEAISVHVCPHLQFSVPAGHDTQTAILAKTFNFSQSCGDGLMLFDSSGDCDLFCWSQHSPWSVQQFHLRRSSLPHGNSCIGWVLPFQIIVAGLNSPCSCAYSSTTLLLSLFANDKSHCWTCSNHQIGLASCIGLALNVIPLKHVTSALRLSSWFLILENQWLFQTMHQEFNCIFPFLSRWHCQCNAVSVWEDSSCAESGNNLQPCAVLYERFWWFLTHDLTMMSLQ